MKKKLILIFDNDSEVAGLDKSYVFCNDKDASSFLLEYEAFIDVTIRPDDGLFAFKTTGWSGTGKCFYAIDKC